MSRTLGYARERSASDDARADAAALRRAGASRVFVDRPGSVSGVRPELERCIAALEAGDTLVLTSVATVSGSIDDLLSTVARLRERGVHVRSLAEPVLSTSASSEVYAALDSVRRQLIGLRTREGLDAARAAGRRPGRPRVMTDDRVEVARELRAQRRSYAQIGRALGVSEAAVRRALRSGADSTAAQPTIE